MCSLRDFSRALYPLAVRRRAPRWLTFWPWPWPWPSSYGSGSPPAARTRRVSRSENRECIESASERARVDHFCELRARARRSRGRRRPIFFLRIRLAAQQECSAAAPSAASYGVDVAAGGLHRQADGPALITFVHYARARGGAEPAAGRFSFCESGWRRSRSVRRRRRAQRATGSTSPPAACTGKLMGLGRVLAPRFQPCPLSVGGTAPRAALAYFLALAWPWQSSYGSGSPPAARTRRVSRSENRECIESASERARVDHFCELHARARRSRARRRPIFFLRIRLAAQQECSAAAPSAASYGVDVAAGGLHRQADGSRPCARSEICVPSWRYGAGAGWITFWPWPGRGLVDRRPLPGIDGPR